MSFAKCVRGGTCCSAQHLLRSAAALLVRAHEAVALNDADVERCIAQATELLESVAGTPCGEGTRGVTRGGMAAWQIRRILSHIEANVGSPMPLPELAGLTGLSVAHFSRSFKASVGETPQIYITGRRVARARSLLLTTDASLSQIALICGFSDQSHFSRQFRKHTGFAPNKWRREMLATQVMRASAAQDPAGEE